MPFRGPGGGQLPRLASGEDAAPLPTCRGRPTILDSSILVFVDRSLKLNAPAVTMSGSTTVSILVFVDRALQPRLIFPGSAYRLWYARDFTHQRSYLVHIDPYLKI